MQRRGMSPCTFETLTTRAREMRHEPAAGETILWSNPRDRQLGGFYCHGCRLVVELDRDGHAEPDAARRDLRRTEIIERAGVKVIRFWNTDVFDNLAAVLEAILSTCNKLKNPSP